MIQKRKTVITAIALSVLLVIGISLTYLFAVALPQKREKEQLLKAMQEYYDAKIATYIDENEKYDDYEVDVAFLGDSLTDGYDLEKYYPQYLVLNRGIGGDTTFGLEKRLKVSVYDLKPKVAVMLIGANNFDTMFDNYENILKGFKENLPNTKIVLLSLTSMPKSPLFKRISRLGTATPGVFTETITQATFVGALMKYISPDENKDRDLYMRGKKITKADLKELRQFIFRNMMIEERDDDIAVIIFNYFSAVRNRWPEAWDNFGQGNILNRTNGFKALMRLLKPVYLYLVAPGEIPTIEQFSSVFNKISSNDFSSDTYKPGSSGESLLYNTLLTEASLQNNDNNSLF